MSIHPAEGDRGGLTSQQQQQQKHPPISVRARHALNLYEQCIRAGQWARVTIEQRDEGESISFFSRPLAAGQATAARRHRKPRRPNKKRVEKRMMWRSSQLPMDSSSRLHVRRKGSGSRTSLAASSQGECQQSVSQQSVSSSQQAQLDQPHQAAALMQRRWQWQKQRQL